MTPKQKGNELIDRMSGFTFEDCKANALVCVNEIVNYIERMNKDFNLNLSAGDWIKVKKSIEQQQV